MKKNKEKKNRLRKNKFHKIDKKTILLISLIALLALLLIFSLKYTGRATGGTISSDLQQKNSISPKEIDFPSTEGGTFTGWAGEQYFQDAPDEVMVLFASSTVPGLAMLYYPYQNRLVVGTPQMVVEDITLFKREKHMVSYSFVNGGEQKFYYDGELKASGEFKLQTEEQITGMAIGTSGTIISEYFERVEIK